MVASLKQQTKRAVKWFLTELELYEQPELTVVGYAAEAPTPPAAEQTAVEPAAPTTPIVEPVADVPIDEDEDFDPLAGMPLTMDNVQDVLDDMVRPALQSDGGDITLLKIENNDIYVKLVGACSSCPSAIMTMKMGVERLLNEEFPEMGDLIQVEGGMF